MYFSYVATRTPPPPPCRLARPAGWGFEYSITGHVIYRYTYIMCLKRREYKGRKVNTEKDVICIITFGYHQQLYIDSKTHVRHY